MPRRRYTRLCICSEGNREPDRFFEMMANGEVFTVYPFIGKDEVDGEELKAVIYRAIAHPGHRRILITLRIIDASPDYVLSERILPGKYTLTFSEGFCNSIPEHPDNVVDEREWMNQRDEI